jgi:two-component system OmpR family sensor kinase
MLHRVTVRWRIAAITAGLTCLILVSFAAVLGNLVGDRIRNDFNEEVRDSARALASQHTAGRTLTGRVIIYGPKFTDVVLPGGAVIQAVDDFGRVLAGDTTDPSAQLGAPNPAAIVTRGDLSVAAAPVASDGSLRAFVQYARPNSGVDNTIARLWLFLGAGVLGGTLLALLAGFGVADRAMRPIAALTAAARDIAATRDPSRRMPIPEAEDEVGELARTMDGMLRALDEARSERERAFERQREFVADASHELRTPLTSVQANLELLQDTLEASGEDRQAVDSALASTRRMSRLVSDLLLLARADAGRRATQTELDLAEVIAGARDELDRLTGERVIRSEIEGPLPVRGNRDELHRLVVNLLENAVRHTPATATVDLKARPEGGAAILEVSDDGPGIPAGMEE